MAPKLIPKGAQWTPVLAGAVLTLLLARLAWQNTPRWFGQFVFPNP